MRFKLVFCILLFASSLFSQATRAQKGLFLKFSLGQGYLVQSSGQHFTGYILAAKNHAVGWGFNEKYAVYVGEFGGLVRVRHIGYDYINLDAYALGFRFTTPENVCLSLAGGYGKVSFANNWYDPGGDFMGDGFTMNASVDKKWNLSDRWKFGVGPHVFYVKTHDRDYRFVDFCINFMIEFYFTRLP
jgi:hypothetical protein